MHLHRDLGAGRAQLVARAARLGGGERRAAGQLGDRVDLNRRRPPGHPLRGGHYLDQIPVGGLGGRDAGEQGGQRRPGRHPLQARKIGGIIRRRRQRLDRLGGHCAAQLPHRPPAVDGEALHRRVPHDDPLSTSNSRSIIAKASDKPCLARGATLEALRIPTGGDFGRAASFSASPRTRSPIHQMTRRPRAPRSRRTGGWCAEQPCRTRARSPGLAARDSGT
jgi:hypothetical protein